MSGIDRIASGAQAEGDPPRSSLLVATKLDPPLASPAWRERERLSARLDGAVEDRTRLTLVAAPPGYGKTVAVAGWLASRKLARAWLSLEPADGDLARFVRYLSAALGAVRPAAVRACERLLVPGTAPAPESVAAALLEAIAETDTSFVVVLDDYQAIGTSPVHALVRILVERAPPFCHPVVVSREDPPLPLARLRAHDRLVELRVDDLRFNDAEAAQYVERAGLTVAPEPLARLVERTEGWVAGLQLASISLAHSPDPGAAIEAFGGSQRFVLDYLADEVLEQTEPDMADFLVRASVADRFTAGLCAELTGRADAADLLERAERAQLFLVPLDEERRWYRFHHLFADYLRGRLGEAERHELHERAAGYLVRAGLAREAIPHLLAAGAFERVAALVEREARPAFESAEIATLLDWLERLPRERLEASAELTSWRAWALFLVGELAAADELARRRLTSMGLQPAGKSGAAGWRAGPPTATANRAAAGRLLVLRALLQTIMGPDAEPFARAGLELIGEDDYFRASALQAIGLAELARGEIRAAVERLREAYLVARRIGPVAAFPAATPLVQALNAAGMRPEAEAICLELLDELGSGGSSAPAMSWFVDVVLGALRYEANDVATARRSIERGFEAAGKLRVGRTLLGWAVPYLAFARHATGSREAAHEALATAGRDIRASGLAVPHQVAETEARLWLLEGDAAAAGRWADGGRAVPPGPLRELLVRSGDVTASRVRLAQRRPDEAAVLLRGAEASYRSQGDVAELISVLVLEASAAEARGRRAEALRLLGEAVALAAPGGYVRRLVEDGARLGHLLPLVRKTAPLFVDEVAAAVAALPAGGGRPGGTATREARGSGLWAAEGELLEALTARELDVLRLLAQGARNADVATSLGVSVGTARWHVGNVLAKLGATSRTQAVVRAQRLGLV